MAFDVEKLLADVFEPEAGETVTVACDLPREAGEDTDSWRERREMAEEWRQAAESLGRARGFQTNPLLIFPATGANNAQLPARARLGNQDVAVEDVLGGTTLALFLTQFSATAPLSVFADAREDFRAASMPGIERRMQRTALAADYREVARRCRILEGLLRGAQALEVVFSTGHACAFDLRHRQPEMDDGYLPRRKPGDRVINLPSGETFIVPYEGEQPGVPSQTEGVIPVSTPQGLALFRVAGNRVSRVEGVGTEATRLRSLFVADPARANVAEVAFGCNERAEVTGNVLEDEKAGFHWAYGRSEHLGGTVGPTAFLSPETVLHQDIVYARGNPIQVALATVVRERRIPIMRNGEYLVF